MVRQGTLWLDFVRPSHSIILVGTYKIKLLKASDMKFGIVVCGTTEQGIMAQHFPQITLRHYWNKRKLKIIMGKIGKYLELSKCDNHVVWGIIWNASKTDFKLRQNVEKLPPNNLYLRFFLILKIWNNNDQTLGARVCLTLERFFWFDKCVNHGQRFIGYVYNFIRWKVGACKK